MNIKESLINLLYWFLSYTIMCAAYTYLVYSFGFNLHHSVLIAIVLTIPTQQMFEVIGYLRDIKDQRKDLVDGLNKIADRLNETKEADERMCDELEKINNCARNEEARKALNS